MTSTFLEFLVPWRSRQLVARVASESSGQFATQSLDSNVWRLSNGERVTKIERLRHPVSRVDEPRTCRMFIFIPIESRSRAKRSLELCKTIEMEDHRMRDHRMLDHRIRDHRMLDHRMQDRRMEDHRVEDRRIRDRMEFEDD